MDSINLQKSFLVQLVGGDANCIKLKKENISSVYERVRKYLTEPDHCLDPSPEVNEALSDLVALLQGVEMKTAKSDEYKFGNLERRICRKIDDNEILTYRANEIRSIAIRAESRMELYWSRRLAKKRSVVGPQFSFAEKIRIGSEDFPYVTNYIDMVEVESKVILEHLKLNKPEWFNNGRKLRVVFCGSGPLPLTGFLLSTDLNAIVTLIDRDAESVRLSKQLLRSWEARNIIEPGMVNIILSDGGDLQYERSGGPGWNNADESRIECDILFLAALIPNDVKEKIAFTVSKMREHGPLLVLRTAHGLTARFAYFKNRRSVVEKYLSFEGLVAPEVHKIEGGYIVDDDVKPMGYFPSDILNSLEIFGWRKGHETCK